MSGYTRWEGRSKPADDIARITQQAYMDGYIMALEDFLQDTRGGDTAVSDLPGSQAYKQLRKVASHILQNALAARKQLRKEIQDDVERSQALLALGPQAVMGNDV